MLLSELLQAPLRSLGMKTVNQGRRLPGGLGWLEKFDELAEHVSAKVRHTVVTLRPARCTKHPEHNQAWCHFIYQPYLNFVIEPQLSIMTSKVMNRG